MNALCKVCLFYDHREKTCARSVVAVSREKIHHNYAKFVRLDKDQCGPGGKWFAPVMAKDGLSPVDELFDI